MDENLPTFRDHFLSIFQSAASDYDRQLEAGGLPEGRGATPRSFASAASEVAAHRFDARVEPTSEEIQEGIGDVARVCTALGMRYLQALVIGDDAGAALVAEQMEGSTCDPKWIRTLQEYRDYFGNDGVRRKIPYVRPSEGANPIRIRRGARIALFGDWGTGARMARQTLDRIKAQKPDILIHLGDIYYSGTEAECAANFENVIEDTFRRTQHPLPVFSLAGNHDMYSGGIAYYDLVRRLNAGPESQKTSFFCLRSEDDAWQLLAMDTGLHDYSPLSVGDALTFVEEEEQAWLEQRVREFGGATILLSHHQLFSAFSQIGKPSPEGALTTYNPNLLRLFRRLKAAGGRIPAWFWGHEHNLCIYEPHLELERGRCIGHGAIPIFAQETPYKPLADAIDPPELVENTELQVDAGIYEHGFAMLTLGEGARATTVEYFAGDRSVYGESF